MATIGLPGASSFQTVLNFHPLLGSEVRTWEWAEPAVAGHARRGTILGYPRGSNPAAARRSPSFLPTRTSQLKAKASDDGAVNLSGSLGTQNLLGTLGSNLGLELASLSAGFSP